jgi:hypothetical protein
MPALGDEGQPAERLAVARSDGELASRPGYDRARTVGRILVDPHQGLVALGLDLDQDLGRASGPAVGTQPQLLQGCHLQDLGPVPTEWCSFDPGIGQWSSTSRILDAPTTQVG